MFRGTTPILQFNLPFSVSNISKLYITGKQYDVVVLEKDLSDCIVNDTSVSLKLTQEETLMFPTGNALVQINWTIQEGNVTKRIATEIKRIESCRNLKEEVI